MNATDTWLVRRSRLPALAASLLVTASGLAGLTGPAGGWFWAGAACACLGVCGVGRTLLAPAEAVRIRLGAPLRLESECGDPIAAGVLDGCSVVLPGLIALRIRGHAARGHADLVLDPWSASAEDLRRLRQRLLGDAALRG